MVDKDAVHFISEEEHLKPIRDDLKYLCEPIAEEPSSFLPDGRINEECTCLHSAFAHRCGYLMREAVRCFNASQATPRGADCGKQFIEQTLCVEKYNSKKK
ncbi:hypothetical protein Q1695_007052 [Nippostrongylus brasiliensis]|nr:hypothetical protein Q1695_007052 [Nippostrongylus brasiliensis]